MDILRVTALLLVLVSAQAAAQAYRWVDEDGVVHYSDRYEPGAEEVALPKSNSVRMRVPTPRTRAADDAPTEPAGPIYESLSVAAPAAEETLWNIGGTLNVSLAVTPGVRAGHRVRVYLDGRERMVESTNFELTEVYRGAHNLQAEILDENGRMLIRSEPIRFYVQQSSILTAPGAARPQTAP